MATEALRPLDDEDDIEQDESAPDVEEGDEDSEPGDPLEGKEHLQEALKRLYLKCCEEDRYPRLCEVMDAQQGKLYWRNLQYCWWNNREESWNLPNQNNGLQVVPSQLDDMPRFEFVTNIYQAFGLSLIAAIAQSPPRTRFFPEDADEPKDVETAEGFTKLAKIIERWNPVHVQLQDEVYELWTGAVVGAWTRYIADGDKYGFESVEDIKEEPDEDADDEIRCAKCGFTASADEVQLPGACPQCGAPLTEDNLAPAQAASVPAGQGEEDVPKGRETVTIVGALNLKRPQYSREQSEWHYFAFEEEIHYAKLRAAHPDIAKKIKPGQGIGEDNGFERNARLGVMQGTNLIQQTGEAQSVLTTYARVWFRPTAFWNDCVKEEDREELLDIFPRGCRVNFAGSTFCESEEQSMDDCWTVTHAIPGDGQHRPALGSTLISVQDRYNTWSNIQAETYEYGLPVTYRDAALLDSEADQEISSEPGSTVDVVLAAGADINTKILTTRTDSASPDMIAGMADLMGPVAQFLTGAFPALLGAGAAQGAAGDTASGYKMQMEQALGRCGVTYVRLKQFHADIQTLACKDYCAHATGKASMSVLGPSGDFESETVDITALEGDAKAYAEGDENYPELWTQQRNTFMQIMDSPQGAALMQSPKNAELAVKLIGITGVVLPGAQWQKKALRIIQKLTAKVPSVDPKMPDMSPDMSSQVQTLIDPLEDHGAVGQAAKDWLFDDAGVKCEKENPQGFANVHAYATAELAMVPPPPPPEKPLSPSMTMALDKMPPEVQSQVLKAWGIDTSPEDFVAQAALKNASTSKSPTQAPPSLPPKNGNSDAGGLGASNG